MPDTPWCLLLLLLLLLLLSHLFPATALLLLLMVVVLLPLFLASPCAALPAAFLAIICSTPHDITRTPANSHFDTAGLKRNCCSASIRS
jgi:hypothetical protein